MTIYELILASCINYSSLNGDYGRNCSSRSSGLLYRSKEDCERSGKSKINLPVLNDSNEDRRVESYRCVVRAVE